MENMPEKRTLTLDESAVLNLETIRKWSLFFSILGFIMIGFFVLLFLGMSFMPFAIPGASAMGPARFSFLGGAFALLITMVLYFFPILYMYKFSVHSKNAVANLDQESAAIAFKYLKMHFQFVGILTIIVLAFYLLAGIIAGIGAAIMI